MESPPSKFPARPTPDASRPQLVAGAIGARLRKDLPVASIEPGSDFDKAMREKLARFEKATR